MGRLEFTLRDVDEHLVHKQKKSLSSLCAKGKMDEDTCVGYWEKYPRKEKFETNPDWVSLIFVPSGTFLF